MLVVLAGALRSLCVAAGLLAFLALAGSALIPRRALGRSALRLPCALSLGSLAVAWTLWVAGTLLGTASLPFVLLVWLAVGLRGARALARDAVRLLRRLTALLRDQWPLAVPSVLLAVAALPQLLLPLCDSDGTRYHVAYAKLFLLEGHVFRYPWDVTGSYPQAAEMLYLIAYRLGGLDAPKYVHAGFFAASLAALVLLVHDRKKRRGAALLAVFFLAASPVVLVPATAAFVDHVALFHFAAAALALRYRAPAWLVGAALGGALATKLPAAPGVLGLAAAAIVLPSRGRLRRAAQVLVPIALAFLPFAVQNLLATGDPVFPVGHGLLRLPIPGVTTEALRYASRLHGEIAGGIPWGARSGSGPDEVVGWHHLLGLLAIAVAIRHRELRPLALPTVLYLVLGAAYGPPARYLVPAWFALSIFEAVAVADLLPVRLGVLGTVAALPAALFTARFTLTHFEPLPYLLGREDRTAFLSRVLPGHRAALLLNRLPPGGRVMALDYPSPVYFDRPWIGEGILTETPLRLWLRESPSADALLARLRRHDVRYLVVTPGYGGGTPLSLLLVAERPEAAGPLLELRRRLRLAGRVDGVDILAVPRSGE